VEGAVLLGQSPQQRWFLTSGAHVTKKANKVRSADRPVPPVKARRARRGTKAAATQKRRPVSIALLRGINVVGKNQVPMAELRALATELGFGDVETYIASGNLLFTTKVAPAAAEAALEAAIEERFGFPVAVIVRTGDEWLRYAAGSAFPDAERDRPNLLLLGSCKREPAADAVAALQPYCTNGERLAIAGKAIWIDYRGGVGTSKVTAALDRKVGSPVTARNWRTVQALAAMVRERGT
jgi:uncharacterized protein (DUF1697 family)